MGQIRIKSVLVENFLTIRKATMSFEDRGLVLVEGPNGSGKSSLFVEPLTYTLFGISERYGKQRDELINRFVGKDLHSRVVLSVDDAEVDIKAYRSHHLHKDNLYLFVNGVDRRGNSNDATWGKIEKILDMDYTAFVNSVVFSQALAEYFSGLSDSLQKEVVERLLGITWIPEAYEIAKQDKNDCLNRLVRAHDVLEVCEKSLKETTSELEECRLKFSSFEKERKDRIKELTSSMGEVLDFSTIEKEIKKIESKKVNIEKEYEGTVEISSKLREELFALTSDESSYQKDIKRIDGFLDNVSSLQIGSSCEFCGQSVTEESSVKYKSHLLRDRKRYEKQLIITSSNRESKSVESQNCVEKVRILQRQIKEIGEELKGYNSEVQELKIENAKVAERNSMLKKQIEESKASENVYKDEIVKLEKEVESFSKKVEESKAESDGIYLETGYHKFWEEGYSNRGLKSFIIESVIPQMNEYARLYSEFLGGKFGISFSAQKSLKKGEVREKFYVDVLNKEGAQKYEGNSSGERRAIDAIVMFVLGDLVASRSNKRFSTLILDDVFEKLDESICNSIIKVLRSMVSKNSEGLPHRENIFVLTHLEYFKSKFENRIIVGRNENGQTYFREN